MKHRFKVDPEGKWSSSEGTRYTVVCVHDDSKHSKQAGWCDSLETAIKAARNKAAKAE